MMKEKILNELIDGEPVADAPSVTKREGRHIEFVIGIGKDHSALVTLEYDSYRELKRMHPKTVLCFGDEVIALTHQ